MEKTTTALKLATHSSVITNHVIWDCGSSLYDSFELKEIEKVLNSAMVSKSLSMPHLSDHGRHLPPPQSSKKPTSKLSCSFHRLIRTVFRPTKRSITTNNDASFGKEGFYVDRSPGISTTPDVLEFDGLSPEMRSFQLKRTASEESLLPLNYSIGTFCS